MNKFHRVLSTSLTNFSSRLHHDFFFPFRKHLIYTRQLKVALKKINGVFTTVNFFRCVDVVIARIGGDNAPFRR